MTCALMNDFQTDIIDSLISTEMGMQVMAGARSAEARYLLRPDGFHYFPGLKRNVYK